METYCTTCGAVDSVVSNMDNAGCCECYDTEGYIYLDDYDDKLLEIIEERDISLEEAKKYKL